MNKVRLLLILLLFISCTINNKIFVNAESANNDFDFTYWNISEVEYATKFLKNLNIDNSWQGSKCHFENHNDKEYLLEKTVNFDGNFWVYDNKYNVVWLHTLYAFSNLDTLSKKELTSRLNENGFNEKIEKIDFIDPSQELSDYLFPYTIMVTTENNTQYFFVLQRTNYIRTDKIDCNEVQFFTKEQYIKKYSEKTGNLYINGKLVYDKVSFCGENVKIPIRNVLEGFGFKVSYYRNLDYGNSFRGYDIIFSNDSESYTLNTFDMHLRNTSTGADTGIIWRCYFSNKDNMYYVPDRTVRLIASFFDKSIKVNGENIYLY